MLPFYALPSLGGEGTARVHRERGSVVVRMAALVSMREHDIDVSLDEKLGETPGYGWEIERGLLIRDFEADESLGPEACYGHGGLELPPPGCGVILRTREAKPCGGDAIARCAIG